MNEATTNAAENSTDAPTDTSGSKSTAALVGVVAGSGGVTAALRVITGFLTARLMDPAGLGLFNAVILAPTYSEYLHLGIVDGLRREMSFAIGRGKEGEVAPMASAAQFWALGSGLILGTVALLVGIVRFASGARIEAFAWVAGALMAFTSQYAHCYLGGLYRTKGDFTRLSAINVVQTTVGFVFTAFVWLFHFVGLCIRSIAVTVVETALLHRYRPIRVSARWSWVTIRKLWLVGAPIFGAGVLQIIWLAADSALVLAIFHTEGFGIYSLVVMVTNVLGILPDAVSQVTYPRMLEEYGRSGNMRLVYSHVLRPVVLLMIATIVFAGISWQLVTPMIQMFFPQYVLGAEAIKWALIPAILRSLVPVGNVLFVTKQSMYFALSVLAGIIAYGVYLFLAVGNGANLVVMSQAWIVGRGVQVAALFFFVPKFRSNG